MHEVRCPRCGYDQAGVMNAWRESCPLVGRCSECGLEFAWRDAIVPPRCVGLVEHAESVRQWMWWGVRTFAGVWRPRRFWERVRLEHRTRLWLGVLWIAGACATGYIAIGLGFAILRSIGAWAESTSSFTRIIGAELSSEYTWLWWWPEKASGLEPSLSWVRNFVFQFLTGRYPWWAIPFFVMLWVSPMMLVLLPWTRDRAKVELRHVGRWLLYGQSAWVVLMSWLICVFACDWLLFRFANGYGLYSNWGVGVQSDRWWADVLDFVGWPARSRVIMPLLLIAWLGWWNWCALKRGMRFDEAKILWWAVMVPTVLVGAIVVTLQGIAWQIFPPGW